MKETKYLKEVKKKKLMEKKYRQEKSQYSVETKLGDTISWKYRFFSIFYHLVYLLMLYPLFLLAYLSSFVSLV